MENIHEVLAFYENGAETGRLERGLGIIEAARTKAILARYLKPGMAVYDVGGGVGYYANWLAEQGCNPTLFELAPSAVAYAKAHQAIPYAAHTADARALPAPDASCDALLLMGPLYHLLERESRLQALQEANRVLRPDGLLVAAGISKFSSATWALSTYRVANDFLDDETYMEMLRGELTTGRHHRPEKYPNFIAQAYFHTPEALAAELAEAGFSPARLLAVEGCIWYTPNLNEKWSDPAARARLEELLSLTESEPSLLGLSPHFLAISTK
ncbi:class I SAM-dependent methyltransferase [Acutalibacter caecimuris]|uniref:class I SAM-dependent methyltransferase n=1 Tax=Acutalibacter caecimuris TaxID=3093657 RepID=UPI002AC9B010|nr:class I SAM-dependent methyltransferase [Acutalibacter sp. M00118]